MEGVRVQGDWTTAVVDTAPRSAPTSLLVLPSVLTMSPTSLPAFSFGGKEEAQEHRQELELEQPSWGHEDTKSILSELARDPEGRGHQLGTAEKSPRSYSPDGEATDGLLYRTGE